MIELNVYIVITNIIYTFLETNNNFKFELHTYLFKRIYIFCLQQFTTFLKRNTINIIFKRYTKGKYYVHTFFY